MMILASLDSFSTARSEWSLVFEGISPGLAFLLFSALTGGTIFGYWKYAPETPRTRWYAMVGLRVILFAMLAFLAAKPALNLTVNEPVRQSLMVLVDSSQSMAVTDTRTRPEDLKRAALAIGLLDPRKGLAQELPPEAAKEVGGVSRWELLRRLTENEKLDFWPRVGGVADLEFVRFGREASLVGTLPEEGKRTTIAAAASMLGNIKPDQPATAIGDALRQSSEAGQGKPALGVFLITDGQSNAGSPAIEAAQIAREQGVPLYIYGLGVASPPDLILREIEAQKLSYIGERVEVKAKVRVQSMPNSTIAATLLANGVAVDEKSVTASDDGEYEVSLSFIPEEAGETKLEVSLAEQPGEVDKGNNLASAKIRVTDAKFDVLLIEQEPRWDFRYLLAYLEKDRRLKVRCSMILGEPDLDQMPDSPFLPRLPETREDFFQSQVLILGDVNPDDLGEDRMRIIQDWVEAGGGIIFLAGHRFNPLSYVGTPLEPLLPVIPDTISSAEDASRREPEAFKLALTSLGESSPYLQMSSDPEENREIWDKFPGVRWTAPVARVKPGAEVLLVDPRPEKMGPYGPQPVFAMQGYGAGTCVYFGTDETYRWRSRTGEKYYSILWGQIMQSLSLQLLESGSPRTQLRTDRREYSVGDKVTIAGRAYTEGFEPLIAPSVEGTVTIESESGKSEMPLNLSALPEQKGFQGEFVAAQPGEYSFTTARDPDTVIRFQVTQPRLEQTQTALNERMLKAMAETSGGQFLREEDLFRFPELLSEKTATVAAFKKVELYHSAWWLLPLIGCMALEWLIRRLSQLK